MDADRGGLDDRPHKREASGRCRFALMPVLNPQRYRCLPRQCPRSNDFSSMGAPSFPRPANRLLDIGEHKRICLHLLSDRARATNQIEVVPALHLDLVLTWARVVRNAQTLARLWVVQSLARSDLPHGSQSRAVRRSGQAHIQCAVSSDGHQISNLGWPPAGCSASLFARSPSLIS